MATTAISLDYIKTTLLPSVASSHDAVKTAISNLGSEGDIGEMLEIQLTMAGYTTMTELVSTLTKQTGDSIKGIVQKSG